MPVSVQSLAVSVRARFGRDERGASLVEYTLLVALIAVVCFAAIGFFGSSVGGRLGDSGSSLFG